VRSSLKRPKGRKVGGEVRVHELKDLLWLEQVTEPVLAQVT
jgi:hypothetical protein